MKTVINFVAFGDEARSLAPYAVDSLMLSSYLGDVCVITDGPVAFRYSRPKIIMQSVPDGTPAEKTAFAKLWKICSVANAFEAGYDRVVLADVDMLFTAPINPILRRAADGKIHAALAGRNLTNSKVKQLMTPEQIEQHEPRPPMFGDPFRPGTPMIDTYFVVMDRTPANVLLVETWLNLFPVVGQATGWHSDATAFNKALLDLNRFGDVVPVKEAERLRGKPTTGTTINHYVGGQHVNMPRDFVGVESSFRQHLKGA